MLSPVAKGVPLSALADAFEVKVHRVFGRKFYHDSRVTFTEADLPRLTVLADLEDDGDESSCWGKILRLIEQRGPVEVWIES